MRDLFFVIFLKIWLLVQIVQFMSNLVSHRINKTCVLVALLVVCQLIWRDNTH